jgi:hypothetical protein
MGSDPAGPGSQGPVLLSRTLRHILRAAPCPVEIAYLPPGAAVPE